METLHGRCHCGAIELQFRTGIAPLRLRLRACSCSFCRRHGARTMTDPNGSVAIAVHAADTLRRYRFGFHSADYLVCGRCGIYVAAVMHEGTKAFATLNANAFDVPDLAGALAEPVDYEQETLEQRRARRRVRWTPVSALREPPSPDSK
jgi:hypothetical protein